MWRSSLGGCVAVLASAVLISACSNDSRNSTEPVPPPVSESIVPAGCPTVTQTAQMIVALYPKGADRVTAAAAYAAILLYINTNHQADARTLVFRLLDFTLQRYNAGKLIGGYSATTQQQLLAFEMGLYCTVGLPTTGLVLPGSPTDRGVVNTVVYPSTTTQNIVTQNGNAGVQIPGGVLTGPVLVTIIPVADSSLHTTLDQYGPLSDVKVSPETSLNANVSVGICADALVIPPTVFLAHNNSPTTIEVLPRGVDFISGLCGVITQPAPTQLRTAFNLGRNGDLAGATKLVGSTIADMLHPTNANATGGGITGTTRKFSPFGGVDTKVYMTANSPLSQTAPAGSAVASPPSAIVKTGRGVLVASVNVNFSVTSGGGTVANGSSSTVATGTTGVATVSDWVINAGSNTVLAVGTYADPSVTFASSTSTDFPQAVAVATDPAAGITYTATGSDIISYGSSYLFQNGTQGHDAGFESPTFATTNWSTGNGPFGSASLACPLNHEQGITMNTAWTVGNDLTLRKSFPLPSWWTAPLTVTAAIDNDIQVFVNGNDVTPNYSFVGDDASNYSFNSQTGFVTHENCATKGSLTFSVPKAFLNPGGNNVLAIRARDRGDINYVDAKVTPATPR
jgi:hypothetical protein